LPDVDSTKGRRSAAERRHSTVPCAGEIEALFEICNSTPTDSNLEVLFERSRPFVASMLISSFPEDLSIVEDALQDAYLKIFILLKGRRSQIRSVNYLIVIAKNCLVDELRKRRGRIHLDELTHNDLLQLSDSVDRHIENQIIIIAAMRRLDQRTRYVLDSYYLQGRPSEDIARELGIGRESIYTILKRSREYFRSVVAGKSPGFPEVLQSK
jgi:RNA polymerase sigma factor (sigma-70 family)